MKQLLSIISILLLSSCGFHWPESPIADSHRPISISCGSLTPALCSKIKTRMSRRGYRIELNSSRKLNFQNAEVDQPYSALGANEARHYYNLMLRLTFTLTNTAKPKQAALMQTLQAQIDYSYNANQVLNSQRQREQQLTELENRVIELLMLRLAQS